MSLTVPEYCLCWCVSFTLMFCVDSQQTPGSCLPTIKLDTLVKEGEGNFTIFGAVRDFVRFVNFFVSVCIPPALFTEQFEARPFELIFGKTKLFLFGEGCLNS